MRDATFVPNTCVDGPEDCSEPTLQRPYSETHIDIASCLCKNSLSRHEYFQEFIHCKGCRDDCMRDHRARFFLYDDLQEEICNYFNCPDRCQFHHESITMERSVRDGMTRIRSALHTQRNDTTIFFDPATGNRIIPSSDMAPHLDPLCSERNRLAILLIPPLPPARTFIPTIHSRRIPRSSPFTRRQRENPPTMQLLPTDEDVHSVHRVSSPDSPPIIMRNSRINLSNTDICTFPVQTSLSLFLSEDVNEARMFLQIL